MLTPGNIALVSVTFLVAGIVKGVIGLGLPTVSLALLTATLGLKEAMALMLIPSLVTNLWQAFVGGAFAAIVRRFWTLLLAVCIGVVLGAQLLSRSDNTFLSGVLGILLSIYSGLSLMTPQISSPGRWESWLSPTIGAVNGVITGLTGSFVVPGVPYLQALGLPRELLIQAMGILFTVSTLALAIALTGHSLLPRELGVLSLAGLVPAFLGVLSGQRLRRRVREERFRHIFFIGLMVLGAYMTVRALF
jgi:uncharacterized membrane protein YfcA